MNVQAYSEDNICSAIARDMRRRFKCHYSVIIKIPTDIQREHPGEERIEELLQKLQTIAERHAGQISRAHILSTRYLVVGFIETHIPSTMEEVIIFTRECHSNLLPMGVVAECWDGRGNPVSVEPVAPRTKRKLEVS